jgi:hypothetical protein
MSPAYDMTTDTGAWSKVAFLADAVLFVAVSVSQIQISFTSPARKPVRETEIGLFDEPGV